MDDAPDLSKRERELIAVNSLMAELCNETKTIQHQESGKPFLEDESIISVYRIRKDMQLLHYILSKRWVLI